MTIVSTRPRRAAARSRVTALEALPSLRERDVFDSSDTVKHYLRLQLAGEGRELFAVIYLDAQNRAIAFEVHAIGTLKETSVFQREVVMAALRHGAASAILAHSRPTGSVQPSWADKALTQTLKAALSLVYVRVLDHVIVGAKQALSMAERGLI